MNPIRGELPKWVLIPKSDFRINTVGSYGLHTNDDEGISDSYGEPSIDDEDIGFGDGNGYGHRGANGNGEGEADMKDLKPIDPLMSLALKVLT